MGGHQEVARGKAARAESLLLEARAEAEAATLTLEELRAEVNIMEGERGGASYMGFY